MGKQQNGVRAVFTAAVACNTPEERARYLDEACRDKPALRQRVEALLRAREQAGDFLTQDALGGDLDCDAPAILEGPGTVIGHYKLLEQIGEGGFGVVFMAEQIEPIRRKVALKIVKPGMDTKQVIARFEAERQALAMMDHPNIAKIFDAGVTDGRARHSVRAGVKESENGAQRTDAPYLSYGRPYFVMELVHGVPITEFCDANDLTAHERLKLFLTVCEAVQHAHQKGIIHRDLKPSNILVTLHDGKPVPKVIDFGTAKALQQPLTEKTLFTAYGKLIGTPQYMSPEQAELSGLDVDTRADIYSLGVLLYELLTGTTPFEAERLRAAAFDELLRIIRHEEPPKPSTRISTLGDRATEIAKHRQVDAALLRRALQGDLDWIAMKALEKDRARRYDTASALAEDVQRHLEQLPVLASPPSAIYRLSKFIRRRKAMAAGVAAGSIALVIVIVVSVLAAAYYQKQERVQRRLVVEKEEQRNLAHQSLYFADMRVAHADWESGQIPRVLNSLQRYVPRPGEPDLRGWEWYYLLSLGHGEERTLGDHSGNVASVSAHPDGRWLASGGIDCVVRVWDAQSGEVVAELKGHKEPVRCVAWSPDGSLLASSGFDGQLILWESGNFHKHRVLDCEREVWAIAWSPDGRTIAAGGLVDDDLSDGRIPIWDVASGQRLRRLDGKDMSWSLAWHPAGRLLVSGGNVSGNLEVWDAGTGQLLNTVKAHGAWIRALAWSPDGRQFASASGDQRIRIWNPDTWEQVCEIEAAHGGNVLGVAWSPDGKALVSGGSDRMVKFWDPQTGSLLNAFRGHHGAVASVGWWPKLGRVVSAGGRDDGTMRIWDPRMEQSAHLLPGKGPFAWSPDGRQFAMGIVQTNATERTVAIAIVDAATRQPLYNLQPGTNVGRLTLRLVAWSPDGQRLALGFNGDLLQVWDLSQRKEMVTLVGTNRNEIPLSLAWSPDGQLLLTACLGGLARIWSVETKTCVFTFRGHPDRPRNSPFAEGHDHVDNLRSACWNPDGSRIVSGDQGGGILIWEASSGRILHRLWCAGGENQVVFNPLGNLLAAGDEDGTVKIWDANNGREIHVLRGHPSTVSSISWSPDARRLASASEDGTLRIWDAVTGQELLVLSFGTSRQPCVAWNPDGRSIATAGNDVRIFDATAGYELAAKLGADKASK